MLDYVKEALTALLTAGVCPEVVLLSETSAAKYEVRTYTDRASAITAGAKTDGPFAVLFWYAGASWTPPTPATDGVIPVALVMDRVRLRVFGLTASGDLQALAPKE
jgi:hypothetical protein